MIKNSFPLLRIIKSYIRVFLIVDDEPEYLDGVVVFPCLIGFNSIFVCINRESGGMVTKCIQKVLLVGYRVENISHF